MRERWLFLLLCAFLAQLSSSDYAVGNDGSRLDTIRPDPSTEHIFYDDEPVNGSEFASGMAKIRRSRSTKDELKKANDTYTIENAKLKELKDAFDAAHNASAVAEKEKLAAEAEWSEATNNLTKINGQYDQAVVEAEKADETFVKETNNQTAKQNAFTNAETTYNEDDATLGDLKSNVNALDEIYKNKKKAVAEANTKEENAIDNATTCRILYITAQADLKQAEDDWKASNAIVLTKTNELKEINEAIKLYEDYKTIKKEKENAEADKETKYTGPNGFLPKAEAKKAEMQNRKKKLDNNLILSNTIDWKAQTIEEAIAAQAKLYEEFNTKYEKLIRENSTDKNAVKVNNQGRTSADTLKKSLEELKSLGLKGKVEDLKRQYPALKKNAEDEVTNADNEVKRINGEISKVDISISGIGTRLTTLAKGKTEKQIKDDSVNKAALKTNVEGKLASEKATAAIRKTAFDGQSTKFPQIEKTSKEANETQKASHEEIEAAKVVEKEANLNLTNAKNESTTFETNKVRPAEEKMNKAHAELEESKSIVALASVALTTAKGHEDAKKKEKVTATTIEGEKRTAKDKAKDKKYDKDQELIKAVNAHKAKEDEVTQLKATLDALIAKDKEETKAQELRAAQEKKDEEQRQKTLAALGTGLGSAIGILIILVIGGVLVFFLIKRKKKAAKNKRPKKPKIEYISSENGLTIMRKEGEPDKEVIKGDDFNFKGRLKIGSKDKEIPEKHKLDDQEDGDQLLGKLFFDKNMNDAYDVGRGVEICDEKTSDASEGRGMAQEFDDYRARQLESEALAGGGSQRYKKEEPSKPSAENVDVKKSSKSSKKADPKNPPSSSGDDKKK